MPLSGKIVSPLFFSAELILIDYKEPWPKDCTNPKEDQTTSQKVIYYSKLNMLLYYTVSIPTNHL